MVMLVNGDDEMQGTMDKLQAHRFGRLHRAFSVFVFNTKGELLLQQRAIEKYHSGGLWTNTCCGHPRPGEKSMDAARRRLNEEMGMDCPLVYRFKFTYKVGLDNGLTENEIDHVFFGISDELPILEPTEACGYEYADINNLERELTTRPGIYSEWLKICFERVKKEYLNFIVSNEALVD